MFKSPINNEKTRRLSLLQELKFACFMIQSEITTTYLTEPLHLSAFYSIPQALPTPHCWIIYAMSLHALVLGTYVGTDSG
jgi:hypothetical protein